ncbi:tetratricopeptide repeat protein [Saccharothrix sp. Mg75]|uniref:tetratricopeptide repeat protein n=1 Tax=Saccharothrix sp. Mg75 TaxID=3445357 RepID=UPI003EF06138
MSDPKTVFARALATLRDRVPDRSDEAVARRASAVLLPSGRRVPVNARRLGEWVGGQAVPRDFDAVLAVAMATGGVTGVEALRELWRAARQERRPRGQVPGDQAPPEQGPPEQGPPDQVPPGRGPRDRGPAVSGQDDRVTGRATRVVVGRPPTDAAALRDRSALARAVDDALRAEDVRQVLLTGPGGVGKSQLATAAFHRAHADVLVWVGARTRQSVLTGYARAWRALIGAEAGADDEAQADLFLDWARTTGTSWLVVLDDVDDLAELAGLWPAGDAGRSVVTTRRRDAALLRPDVRVVPVGMFDPDEAAAYLSARLSVDPRHRPGDLAALADALGRFPLALSQAAAFLIDTGTGVRAYLDLLADRRQRVADLFPPSSPADEHDGTVAGTVRLAVERASTLAANALDVLGLVAVLSPDGIPEAVLLDGGRNLLALRALHRLNLVTHVGRVEAHALVQRAARDLVPDLAAVATAAADALEREWSDPDPDTAAALHRNAEVLRAVAGEHLWDGGMHPVLLRLARYLASTGRPAAARDVAAELLTRAAEPRDVVVLRTEVARCTGDLGDTATALAGLAEVRALAERELGPTHLDTLWARSHRARFLMETGRSRAALAEFDALLAEGGLPAAHPLVVESEDNRALCLGLAGDLDGAREAATALVAVLRTGLGARHRQTLRALVGLGRWVGETGDAPAAVEIYREAVDGLDAVAGRGAHDTFIARHNLAYWRALAGDLGTAISEFDAGAADAERALGEQHPTTLTYRANTAFWRGVGGDPGAAGELAGLRRVVEEVFGPDHPRVLRIRQQRADLLHRAGLRGEAVAELRAVLVEMTRVQGEDHPRTREAAALLTGWGDAGP